MKVLTFSHLLFVYLYFLFFPILIEVVSNSMVLVGNVFCC